jgi:hypothetical protein
MLEAVEAEAVFIRSAAFGDDGGRGFFALQTTQAVSTQRLANSASAQVERNLNAARRM